VRQKQRTSVISHEKEVSFKKVLENQRFSKPGKIYFYAGFYGIFPEADRKFNNLDLIMH